VEVVFDQLKRLSTSRWRLLEFLPGGSRLRWIVPLAVSFPTPAKRRLDEAIGVLDEVIYDLIARRRAEASRGEHPRDLIGLLLRASEEEGAGFSDEDVRDEAMTMFIAGHETVAATLTWTLYLLARHPEYQGRIAAEADAVLGADRASAPSLEDLARLELAHRVFLEASRLYPAVWRYSRWAVGPDRIGGYDVPAGSVLSISPYLLHRDPAHWPDPGRFDPGRFEAAPSRARSRGVYMPFGAGQRMCPGGSFATAEVQIVLATLLRRVAFEATGAEPRFEPRITLGPQGGLPLRVVPVGSSPPPSRT
jgi:cytochrome P450